MTARIRQAHRQRGIRPYELRAEDGVSAMGARIDGLASACPFCSTYIIGISTSDLSRGEVKHMEERHRDVPNQRLRDKGFERTAEGSIRDLLAPAGDHSV